MVYNIAFLNNFTGVKLLFRALGLIEPRHEKGTLMTSASLCIRAGQSGPSQYVMCDSCETERSSTKKKDTTVKFLLSVSITTPIRWHESFSFEKIKLESPSS